MRPCLIERPISPQSQGNSLQWLFANLFLLGIVLLGAGLIWAVGALMWHFGLVPDDHPAILMLGMVLAIFATYYIGKHVYRFIDRRRFERSRRL